MKHRNLEKCNKCGICNTDCPAYLVTRNEATSPRNKARLALEKKHDATFFSCTSTECDCFKNCPVGVKIDFISIREEMVKEGKGLPENEEMKKNIQTFGNPFGDPARTKNIKKYYT